MRKDITGPFFVVIEGIDGSGKGTQAKMLKDYLKSEYSKNFKEVFLTLEPSKGPLGDIIRENLRERGKINVEMLALLFAADRADHVQRRILPMLRRKNFVISERYVYSSFAYQGQEMDFRWLCDLNFLAIVPDLVIYIDIPTGVAFKRIKGKGKQNHLRALNNKEEFFEKMFFFLNNANAIFNQMSNGKINLMSSSYLRKHINFNDTTIIKVDGLESPEIIHHKIRGYVRQLMRGEMKRVTNRYDFSKYDVKSQRALTEFYRQPRISKENRNKSAQKDIVEF